MGTELGHDSLTGTAIIILGGAIGFSTGTLNASTTLVSQQIAELPPFSRIGYRFVCFGVFYVVTNIFLIRYANKVKKHPEKSPMYDLDKENEMAGKVSLEDFGTMDLRKWLVIGCLVVSLIVIIYGSIALGWDLPEYSAVFLVLAFNFGDGFVNYILPTSGALMGILGAVNIPYDRWVRFMWKCFAMWTVVGCIMVIIAQLMKYGPM